MEYTTTVEINLPRDQFLAILTNEENMKHWMRGLVSYERLSTNPNTEGARTAFKFKMGKREMDMVETILKLNFPEEFFVAYDSKGVHNVQKNYFEEKNGKTVWSSKSEFKFDSFMMKTMAFLMPGLFKKQSRQYADDFKNFAEKGISVLDKE